MVSLFISRRELTRTWQIMRIAGRYGLAPLMQFLGLDRVFRGRIWQRMARRYVDIPPPVRLRMALTEFGTTFIKLGQMLSARSDLLPPEYIDELSKLQDNVPPLPFEQIEPIFRAEFGYSPFIAFRTFDSSPVASASIGQVYRATLQSGEAVSVKIQRPGVQEQVNTDLALMERVAEFAHRNRHLERYDLPSLVREFKGILQDELIYTLEGHNAETLTGEMAGHPNVKFQTVCWAFTTRRVLTTLWVEGVKITDIAALDAARVNRSEIAVSLANSLLEQILLHGMFHGDPHPGNLLVTANGTLYFLDTGMVGRIDRTMRELFIELAIAIFDQDIDAVLDHLQQLGVVGSLADLRPLRRDLAQLITKYYFLPRKELRLGELLQRVNFLLFEHRIRMAYEFGLMAKALFLAEGIAQQLDPDFDYNSAARPVIDAIRTRYYSPKSFVDDAVREWRGLRRQVVDLPRRLSLVLSHLERGTLRMRLHDDLWEAKYTGNAILINRLCLTLLVVGLLVASSLLLLAHPTGWGRYFALGILGVDSLLMIILLVAMVRSGRV